MDKPLVMWYPQYALPAAPCWGLRGLFSGWNSRPRECGREAEAESGVTPLAEVQDEEARMRLPCFPAALAGREAGLREALGWLLLGSARGPLRPVLLSPAQLTSVLTRGSSSASLHNSTIRSTIYRLMLHSLDLGEGKQGLPRPAWSRRLLHPSCSWTTGTCKTDRQ